MEEHTEEFPKLFLDVEGRTILERQLHALPPRCTAVTIVLGYGFEERDPDEVLSRYDIPDHIDIETLLFPDWAEYDNAESCLRALDGIEGEDVLVLCGDVIFDPSVAETLAERFYEELKPAGYNAVGAYEDVQDEMTAVRWDEEGVITDYGAIEGHQETGMYVYREDTLDEIRAILRENRTEWSPIVLPRVPTKRVLTNETDHCEINTPEHLEEARATLPFSSEATSPEPGPNGAVEVRNQ